MGVVYLAEHAVIGRQAAIKLLLPEMSENAEAVTRFFNEARATARIKHPGIVEILDCGTLPNGQAYIVMELLQGETLGSYSERYGKLSAEPELVRAIVRQVAAALGAAHARGIVHRDLKPDNIFLASDGGALGAAVVKILDFGIAKLVSPGQIAAVTTTKELLGTPLYISPEQCKGAKDLDHRSDVYSLGCIAFELLTGAPVFQAHSLGELVAAHMFKEPPPLAELEPATPPAFARLVLRMLAKAPADRPRTMDEIVAALDEGGPSPSLRGAAVVLSPARPLSTALPATSDAAPAPGGVITLPAGGRRPPTAAPTSGTLSGLASEASVEARPGRARRLWTVAAGVAGLVGLVLILVLRAPGGGDARAPASLAVAPTRTVEIDVDDRPPGLTVTVDGRPGRVPVALPLGPEAHTLVFQADGFEPMTRTLDATKSRTLVLGLRRRPAAVVDATAPAAAAEPPRAGDAPATTNRSTKPAAKGSTKRDGAKTGKRRPTDLFLDI